MLSRLNLIKSHVTALPLGEENLLEKYRKMSNLDLKLLDDIYYLDNKDTMIQIEEPIRTHREFR